MREIKFKRYFKNYQTGEITSMIWGCVNYKYKSVSDFSGFVSPGNNNKAYPIADCQFTGLNDKNGVEIWEGDIVVFEDDQRSIVEWKQGGLVVEAEFGDYDMTNIGWAIEILGYCEVIGNIFENPELLQP